MTEIISRNILDSFKRLTTYDIESFITAYLDFADVQYANIVNFYGGVSNVVPTVSFKKLSSLIAEQKKIIDVTILNADSLYGYEYWALIEYVEDIGHVLETAANASKWLRSSVTKNGYSRNVRVEIMAGQGEDLEKIERNRLSSNIFVDSWVETALQNELREEDYTLDGGYMLKVVFKNNSAFFLNGVVDNIDLPEKTYGLDIDRHIIIENDDLVVLGYRDTIIQCAEILGGLKKEDDPSFPNLGIPEKLLVGSNVAAISYPSIFRSLAENFATDDSFRSFGITGLRREADSIFVDYKVETKAGDYFNKYKQLT